MFSSLTPKRIILAAVILMSLLMTTPALAEENGLQVGLLTESEMQSSEAVVARLAENYDVDGITLINSKDYTKYLSYHDDLTNQIGWGTVEVAEFNDNGIHYWFVTNPDPAHANEVQLTLVDFDETTHTNVTLNIPDSVKIDINGDSIIQDSEVFVTTAIGYQTGSSYLTPNNAVTNVDLNQDGDDLDIDKHDITYWYTSARGFVPGWYQEDNTNNSVEHPRHKKTNANLTETYAKQHPFLEISGSNNRIFGPARSNGTISRYIDGTKQNTTPNQVVTKIVIPASVEYIGGYSFYACAALSSIEFEEGSNLKRTGTQPFAGVTAFDELVLPDGFENLDNPQYKTKTVNDRSDYTKAQAEEWDRYIDIDGNPITIRDTDKLVRLGQTQGVLGGLDNLKKLSLPNSIVFNPDAKLNGVLTAFVGLDSLESLTLRGENTICKEVDGILYTADANSILLVPSSISGAVHVPGGVDIGTAFKDKKKLTEVYLGASQISMTISGNAFSGCSALEKVVLPEGVTSIGATAFYQCASLVDVALPDSLSSLGNKAFSGCVALGQITLPDGLSVMPESCFSGCSKLERINLGKNLATAQKASLANCPKLTSVVLRAGGNVVFGTEGATSGMGVFSSNNPTPSQNINLYFTGDVTSIADLNPQTFKSEKFQAGQLTVYGANEAIKSFFTTDGTTINTDNVSPKMKDGEFVQVTYVDISDKIVKIGADTTSATLAGVPEEPVQYTGSAIEPEITVTYGSDTLVEGTDYTLSYSDNLKPGTATVTVEGMGDYVGTLSATFQIVDTEDGRAAADEAAASQLAADIMALPAAADITADNADGIAAVDAAASAYIAMNDAQKSGIGVEALQTLVEAQAKVAEVKEQIAAEAQEKAKQEKEAAEQAAAEAKAEAEQLEKDVAAAKAEAASAKAEAASAKSEASAAKAEAAKAKASASVALAKAKLTKKTKSAKKGKVTVAWKKVAGATGYEVKVGAKTYTVKKASTLKKTVKAAKGKKVKVRVRAFKKQGDNTLYGPWSKAKKVKVKK